ncbi:tRNA-intron lyase [Candidatus Woesearchaeota archaeon]|nr:tRNA-intron lyase [Candidatus Woesearchaeota archaeon]
MAVNAYAEKSRILTEASNEARELNEHGYGTILADGRIQLSMYEATYLQEKTKIVILNTKAEPIKKRKNKAFWVSYAVYRDLKEKGYIVKTALKFGGTFRVYSKGTKPGQAHAKWVVYPAHESETLTWHEFAAKNRVAHSTRKKLLIAIVDDELGVCYWEARWLKP